METVKMDVQKLQLLNERIAQTIEALNQFRMSLHGLQHTSVPWEFSPAYGAYSTPGYMLPYGAQVGSFSPTPYGPQVGSFSPAPYGAQLGSFSPTPFGPSAFVSPYVSGFPHTTTPVASSLGAWSMPYVGNGIGNGISHTAWDPSWQVRAQQAFPFAKYPYPISAL